MRVRRAVPLRELGAWYGFAACVLKPLTWALTRPDWRGVEHVPQTGGVLLAAVDLSAYEGRKLSADVLRAATDAVLDAISTLLEQVRGESRPPHVHDPRADPAAERDERRSA